MASDHDARVERISERIRVYEDFPKPGISFKDIFPLFQSPSLLNDVIAHFHEFMIKFNFNNIDVVVGLDARGFLLGPALAEKLNCSFAPIRKKGKLPGSTISVSYGLEYGKDTLELQKDSFKSKQNVVVIDDLMATGGTMNAACQLLQEVDVNIVACLCVVELTGLEGTKKLPAGATFNSIVQYEF